MNTFFERTDRSRRARKKEIARLRAQASMNLLRRACVVKRTMAKNTTEPVEKRGVTSLVCFYELFVSIVVETFNLTMCHKHKNVSIYM